MPREKVEAKSKIWKLLVCGLCLLITQQAFGEDSIKKKLQLAQSRIRAIYDQGEFRAKRFQAEWLPDSSGYIVTESLTETNERVRVSYDVEKGERTVLESGQQESIETEAISRLMVKGAYFQIEAT